MNSSGRQFSRKEFRRGGVVQYRWASHTVGLGTNRDAWCFRVCNNIEILKPESQLSLGIWFLHAACP